MELTTENITDQFVGAEIPRKFIYLAGSISKLGFELTQKVSLEVERIVGLLMSDGWSVYSPWHCTGVRENWDIDHDVYMAGHLAMMDAFALAFAAGKATEIAILMLSFDEDGKVNYEGPWFWEESRGAPEEYEYSQGLGYPLAPCYWVEDEDTFTLVPMNGGDA